MNKKFEYKVRYRTASEEIELLSINVVPELKLEYRGLELQINQKDTYRIIFIDKSNELREEELESLADLTPLN
jgi:hypothetical protein